MKEKTTLKWKLVVSICALALFVPAGAVPRAHADSAVVLGDILKKTEQYYQSIQAFTAYFEQRTTSASANGMATAASGRLYYQKPRQMRWEYEKPERQIFVANRYLAWLYVPADKQASLVEGESFFSTPLARAFFDGVEELKNHFDVSLDAMQSTKATAVLKLMPKKEDPNIKQLYIWIDMGTHQIVMVESLDALGNTNRIKLESQNAVPSLDPKLFQMDFPPGTAVVDSNGRELSKEEVKSLKQKLHL